MVLQALASGAVDFVQKPTGLANHRMFDMATELLQKVEAAGGVNAVRLRPATAPAATAVAPPPDRGRGRVDVVVIAASTGGPQALRQVIPQLPSDCPVPIAIVLHMPVGYTESYARSLAGVSRLAVREARTGEAPAPGVVLVAPAGYHLSLCRDGGAAVVTRLDVRPADTLHRPSADVLFRSAADVLGERVLAVVLTGMGADGREGAAWIKAKGGTVLTEAEETCVVYGMPRAVMEAGLSDASVPLPRMAAAMMERL
jgi:two-component system chemotaxis response regulator CheB